MSQQPSGHAPTVLVETVAISCHWLMLTTRLTGVCVVRRLGEHGVRVPQPIP